MELKDIVSVAGLPGLHKVIGRNKTGLIVETIGDTSKKFATNLRQRVSTLSEIAVFIEDGETKLWEVLKATKTQDDSGAEVPNSKSSNDEAKAFMGIVLPNYDKEKVYVSDMKKLFNWYHILKPVLDFDKLGPEAEETEAEGEKVAYTDKTAAKSTKEKPVVKQNGISV